ncbi:MAG: group 1 truncated hemoglobin [Alphaproteobacteria bacterium]|nr:group 1 truncated hemoglobin [Alphaproteobacteria bacterium]
MDRDLLVVLDVEKVLDAEQLVKTPPVVLRPRKLAADGKPKKLAVALQTSNDDEAEDAGAEEVKALSGPKDKTALPKPESKSKPTGSQSSKPSLSAPEPKQAASASDSLFDRIGGDAAVEAAVDILYGKLMSDPAIKPFFEGVDLDKQSFMMRLFLTGAFGGVKAYSGRSLREAHKPMVDDKGLSGVHFDKVAGHLGATLQELSVPADMMQEVMALVSATRDDVLNL